MKKISLSILLIFFATCAMAQYGAATEEYLKYMDEGTRFMDNGEYKKADDSFKMVMNNISVLPAEICFFFGKNSYFLKRYKQSINWLNKYIELKGTKGQYFSESKEYLDLAEQAYRASQSTIAGDSTLQEEKTVTEFSFIEQIDCMPGEKLICPVCQGKTVIIKKGAFGSSYETCPYCDEHGLLSCEEYNLLLQGKLQPKR